MTRTTISFSSGLPKRPPSKDGNAISKVLIADSDQIAESWFKLAVLSALDTVTIDWVDRSANDGDSGIIAVHLSTFTNLSHRINNPAVLAQV